MNSTEQDSCISVCIQKPDVFFLLSQYLNNYTLFLKKKRPRLFKLCQALIYYLISSRRWWLLGLILVKNLTFSYKRPDFSVIITISVKTLLRHAIHTIFAFFYSIHFYQILMVSLFLARNDQYFIMFKNSNVFKFTNFPFKTKYKNTVIYSVNISYLFSMGKQEKKLLKQFRQDSMIFKGSPNWRRLISPVN